MAATDADLQRRAAADPALIALVEVEQVRLIVAQARHTMLPHLALDAFVAWVGWNAGVGHSAWIWFIAMATLASTRTFYLVSRLRAGRTDARTMLRIHTWFWVAVGLAFAVMMVMVFARPSQRAHFVLTMILVGNAAGAVAAAAGHLRSYILWAPVYGGTVALCWLFEGTAEGVLIGGLTVLLFMTISLHVRDQGRTLLRLVALREELRRERDRAERASDAKTRFFASASHDLRQPLTALSYHAATVQALAEKTGDDTLTRIGQGIGRALTESRALLDSLLEVSELDAGAVEAQRQPVDVTALLAEIGEAFKAEAEQRGLALRVQVPAGRALVADTDPVLLRRIVQNLVGNALKFTLAGQVSLRAGPGRDPATIEVRIVDTGIGIPPQAQEQVFEEFYQVGNPARDRSRGLGLGLSIVRRLAMLLGTRVEVSSTPEEGSAFWFELPAIAQATPVPREGVAPRAGQAFSAGHRRILVIDDEADIRESVSTMLEACGWDVAAEPGADEALARVAGGFAPDALIVDFRLRGASGLEAIAALRGLGCQAPAWLITGDTEPRRIAEARAAGVPVVYKPVDGLQLATMLREVFEQRG